MYLSDRTRALELAAVITGRPAAEIEDLLVLKPSYRGNGRGWFTHVGWRMRLAAIPGADHSLDSIHSHVVHGANVATRETARHD